MSFYKNIYNDFPLRCGNLWKLLRKQAENKKLDVTFMLMTAAGGLATSFEHLKIQTNEVDKADDHPAKSETDRKKYEEALRHVKAEIDCEIVKSQLFSSVNHQRWELRTFDQRGEIRGYLEQPHQDIGRPLKIKSARDAIKIFRNALAHSNFHAFNRTGASEIDEIAFFSEVRGNLDEESGMRPVIAYDVISLPHSDFAAFLDAWFVLLKRADPSAVYLRVILPVILNDEYSYKS